MRRPTPRHPAFGGRPSGTGHDDAGASSTGRSSGAAVGSRSDEVRQDLTCPVGGRGFAAAGHAPHGWSATWRLPADASCAGIARALLLATLTAPEPPADFIDAALMVTSELAANAIAHAAASGLPELWLHLAHSPKPRLVVSVFDTDRFHLPSLADPTEFEETGRGLASWRRCRRSGASGLPDHASILLLPARRSGRHSSFPPLGRPRHSRPPSRRRASPQNFSTRR